ncbi:MAG: peptidylprolyl isomerase [Cyclobacteriaceae bacterium]|nr:peptidylprolyl isomerase [Cyclobacteriaceae bacterium]
MMTHLKYTVNKRLFLTVVVSLVVVGLGYSQTENYTVVDKIVAKVDSYIIQKSEVERSYLQMQSSGEQVTKCQILEGLVLNKLMVAKAEIDSVVVEESMVDRQLDMRMQGVIGQAGGDPQKLEEVFGKSLEEIREELRTQVKEQLVVEKMQSTINEGVTVTPAEVKRFFKNIPSDSLPYFSTEVEIAQIVKKPVVSKEEKDRIEAQLISIRDEAMKGTDFQVLAGRYSQDPSAPRGGNLGDVERGQMVSEFEGAALKLKNGEISMPVQSEFGFHIIQMVDRGAIFITAGTYLYSPNFQTMILKSRLIFSIV